MALENTDLYLSHQSNRYLALKAVHDRFKKRVRLRLS